jgi:hypothetical protein
MILYHGTTSIFDHFDPELIGKGAEPNSALGVWTTQQPDLALQYSGETNLLVLQVDTPKLATVQCYNTAIWGGYDLGPSDKHRARSAFAAARLSLADQGYDGVWCECPDTDLAAAICVFDPQNIKIIRAIAHAEDRDLDELQDPPDDSICDFSKCLEDELMSALGLITAA